MNRTDRLYALVEELRAVAPRPRSARWLAGRFEVSTRTIERDLSALQQSGVPIYAEPGRTGGYCLDRAHTLPPVNLTPAEAIAMAVALHQLGGTPFAEAGRTGLHKLLNVMPPSDVDAARDFADRVHLVRPPMPAVPEPIASALTASRALRLTYVDGKGEATERVVEPMGYIGGRRWYLLAWCRLREAARAFRFDRITEAVQLDEPVTPRPFARDQLDIPQEMLSGPPLP
ncbi:helix-turn-helix transcriptional regulator [Longispora albida]|uniref:helix-turn-helix transcriptional regulator n=1 Tax=Longispora albida TaxID=203523 RepID=UPI000477D0D7|nr:YafY family protein [Longispora albida]